MSVRMNGRLIPAAEFGERKGAPPRRTLTQLISTGRENDSTVVRLRLDLSCLDVMSFAPAASSSTLPDGVPQVSLPLPIAQ